MAWIFTPAARWTMFASRNFPQTSLWAFPFFSVDPWKERNNYKSAQNAKAKEIYVLKQLEESVIQEVDFQIRLLRTTWETIPMRRQQTAYEEAALQADNKSSPREKHQLQRASKSLPISRRRRSDEIGTLRDYNQAISELNFRIGTTLERWRIDRPVRPNK